MPTARLSWRRRDLAGLILTPPSPNRFGQPAMSVVTGLLTLTIDPDGSLTSLSLHELVLVDVCAALSKRQRFSVIRRARRPAGSGQSGRWRRRRSPGGRRVAIGKHGTARQRAG